MEFYRIVHLANYAKRYRTRKKNKNRIKRAIERLGKSIKSINLKGCLGFANNVVFHEYGTADGEIFGEAREE